MDKINVGLIGFGPSGKYLHTPLLKSHIGFEITKVFSSRRDEILSDLPNAIVVSEVDEIFQDPKIGLVVITAPNEYHYQYSRVALNAGKHVVVEKPFVNSTAEGEELISLAKSSDKVLTVYHNRRWDSDFLTVKKLIESGRLGQVMQFESHFDRYRPENRYEKWREKDIKGSGIFYDLGSHLIDQALILFGMPDSLTADIACQKMGAKVDDYFHLILIYGRTRVILHASSFSNTSPRFQIHGTNATYTKYGFDQQESSLRSGIDPSSKGYAEEKTDLWGSLITLSCEPNTIDNIEPVLGNYLSFYEQLYDRLKLEGKESPVTPQSALAVIKIIELAFISAREGRRVSLDQVKV